MENQEYVFTPIGDQPTKENLRKNLFKAITVVAVVCAVASNFAKSSQQIYFLIAFLMISAIVYGLMVTTKYIKQIRLNASEATLYLEYVTISGKEGTNEINLLNAKYSYRFSASNGYQGYTMKLNDKKSKLEIRETKSSSKQDQKNRFLKDQLDQMNQIITDIRSRVN